MYEMEPEVTDVRAIVTGATGFIGKALCEELLKEDYSVVAVIRKNSQKRGKLENLIQENPEYTNQLHIMELDLEDLESLHTEYHIQADVFYHLAWNGSSGADREDFDMQYSNIAYTKKAIKTAKDCGCKKIVGAGSQAEYGVILQEAKEDEAVPRPFMMYGAAKLSAYQMGQIYAKQIGIKMVWPRIYSIYGVGENSGTLVSYVIDTLKKGEIPQLSPCENMWNFMYITDCVRALRMLGESADAEGIYNVASKDTRVLKEFVKEIRDLIAPGMELNFGAKQSDPGRTFWLMPDCGRLETIWAGAKVTFGEGIRKRMKDI